METLKHIATVFGIGVVAGLGMKATEWVVPSPEARIVVCMQDDMGGAECRNLKALISRAHDIGVLTGKKD